MPASSGFTDSRTLLLTLRDGAPASAPYTVPTPYTTSIPYTLVRSRRKSLAIIVRPDASLEVRIPLRCREDELQKFLQSLPHGLSGKEKKGAGSQNAAPF